MRSWDEAINFLGMKSLHILNDSFISEDAFFKSVNDCSIILPTERFYSNRPLSVGSSRHAIVDNVQVKGIGQNILNTSYQYDYNWGGYLSIDALISLAKEMIISKRSALEPLKTLGLFRYKISPIKGKDLVIQFREADTFRLAQIHPSSCSRKEKEMLLNFLTKEFEQKNINQILEFIVENIIKSFSKGVAQSTPSLSNLTINGKWIDAESVDITKEEECYPLYIEELIIDETKYFFNSWIHNLYLHCENYVKNFEGLFDISFDLDSFFESRVIEHINPVNKEYWFKLLKEYPSWRKLNNDFLEHTELKEIRIDEKIIKNKKITKLPYQSHLMKGEVIHYTDKDILSKESLFKTFLAFNSSSDNADVAKENYEKLWRLLK